MAAEGGPDDQGGECQRLPLPGPSQQCTTKALFLTRPDPDILQTPRWVSVG